MKNRHKKTKKLKIFAAAFLIAAAAAGYYSRIAAPTVRAAVQSGAKAIAAAVINDAAYGVNETVDYGDLIKIIYDKNGDISLILTDAVKINRIARDVTDKAEERLSKLNEPSISLHALIFTGISALSSYGSELKIKVDFSGGVGCEYKSSFFEAGINQTVHRIYLTVNVFMSVSLPMERVETQAKCDLLIAESLIIGRVPDVYLNGSNDGERIFNLLP
ncbi:MAG: hypothetical protein LBQ27_00935 [Clostridiales bacterium]|jgi:sporulation protein YunB|nr:hypothetical protein [Clostridiales bacterium]